MKKLKVCAYPKKRGQLNPYTPELYDKIESLTPTQVDEFLFINPFVKKYDILHIHWPGAFVTKGILSTLLRQIYFYLLVGHAKHHGIKLFWTAHNVTNHEQHHAYIEEKMMRFFTRHLDGVITLGRSAAADLLETYPLLTSKPMHVIPHGLYESYPSSVSREAARERFGLPPDARVFLFVGRVEPYKNVTKLVCDFKKMRKSTDYLLIAGRCARRDLCVELSESAATDPHVMVHDHFVPAWDYQYYFAASDLMVLPYRDIMGSGTAMLALSFDTPILCPSKGMLKDLEEYTGKGWVHHFGQGNIFENLDAIMESICKHPPDPRPMHENLGNERIARLMYTAYLTAIKD